MAVPFVQDWDIVQTLGEGAYGEYESSFVFTTFSYYFFIAMHHQVLSHTQGSSIL